MILKEIHSLPFEKQPDKLSVEENLNGEVEYSHWQERGRMGGVIRDEQSWHLHADRGKCCTYICWLYVLEVN